MVVDLPFEIITTGSHLKVPESHQHQDDTLFQSSPLDQFAFTKAKLKLQKDNKWPNFNLDIDHHGALSVSVHVGADLKHIPAERGIQRH